MADHNPKVTLASDMKSEYEALSPLSSDCCIYRVSERLRQVNEKAYTPQVVSIGPLHHGKESLKPMEEHKIRFLWAYINRTKVNLEYYIDIVKKNEEKLRNCYAEPLPLTFDSDALVKIVLVDAAFLIEILLRNHFVDFQDSHDRIFRKPWMLQDIWPDLRLLENQLPFFIIEELFQPSTISFPPNTVIRDVSIVNLLHTFFKEPMHLEGTEYNLKNISSSEVEHFVDFLRRLHIPTKSGDKKGSSTPGRQRALGTPTTRDPEFLDPPLLTTLSMPPVTELHQAGVKFRTAKSKNIFDISFSNGILEIPKLTISDESELTLRNLLAFEQYHCEGNNYINDYAVMMDRLVNTAKDVDLLVKHGIVENRLGDSSEAATLINKLGDGATIDYTNFYFASITMQLDQRSRTPWHKWKTNLRHNYFNTPWAIVSVIAAVLLIILTIIQAVCSVISARSSPSH